MFRQARDNLDAEQNAAFEMFKMSNKQNKQMLNSERVGVFRGSRKRFMDVHDKIKV